MKSLEAIYSPITTPFLNNEISFSNLKSNVKQYNKYKLRGYVVGGSNGETVFLTREEKLKLVGIVREHASFEKQIIAGTGSESIKETIQLTNLIANEGADFALIITPHFFKDDMSHRAFLNYYRAIADSVKIPVIIYNVTKFTGVNICSETIVALSEHPNIAGIKNSNTDVDELNNTIRNVPEDFAVLAGTGSVLLPALVNGAKGGVLALANIAPFECICIFDFFNEGKMEEAEKLQSALIPVNKAITSKYGIAGLKASMDIVGFFGGNPRMPIEPLSEVHMNDLKKILTKASLIK